MTDEDVYDILKNPLWNKSCLARELYPERKRAESYFHERVKRGVLTKNEIKKIKLLFKTIKLTTG